MEGSPAIGSRLSSWSGSFQDRCNTAGRSFGFAQDDSLGCVIRAEQVTTPVKYIAIPTQQITTRAKYIVIPTAVEGSPAIGSRLSSWSGSFQDRCNTAGRSFGFAQDDSLGCVIRAEQVTTPVKYIAIPTQQITTRAKYIVIPTAVEGSPAVGSRLSSW